MKKVVSQFEYAITEITDPEAAKKCRPRTDAEELEFRRQNIMKYAKRIRIKKP